MQSSAKLLLHLYFHRTRTVTDTMVKKQRPTASPQAESSNLTTSPLSDDTELSSLSQPDSATPISPKTDVVPDCRMSPEWDYVSLKYMERNNKEGAYSNLLNVLQQWKNDDSSASRIAAFMKFEEHIKPFPAFGGHLTYRREKDDPLRIVFFGEVAPNNTGTSLGARGNHFAGSATDVRISIANRTIDHMFCRESLLQTRSKFGTPLSCVHPQTPLLNSTTCTWIKFPF